MAMFWASPSKGWVHHLSSLSFPFHFGLIYIVISMIMPHVAFTSSCLCSCISTIDSSLIIILTLICHFHLLLQTLPPWLHSLYVQPCSPYLPYFLLYSLPALKGGLPIYTGLLPLMYFNLDLHQYTCWSIFSCFLLLASCFWKSSCL